MIAPAFHPFAAVLHCMVVPESSTSPAMFSWTFAAPSKTCAKSRLPETKLQSTLEQIVTS